MINQKKGLSDIVTNVLIILLVLVAVGIIWAFLNPTIRTGAGQLGGVSDCLTIQLEPISCVSNGLTSTQVKFERGAGSGTLKSVKFVFQNATTGIRTVYDATDVGWSGSLPTELGTGAYSALGLGKDFSFESFGVAAVVDDGSGGFRTCSESTVRVACT